VGVVVKEATWVGGWDCDIDIGAVLFPARMLRRPCVARVSRLLPGALAIGSH